MQHSKAHQILYEDITFTTRRSDRNQAENCENGGEDGRNIQLLVNNM